ncbi:MAG: hypothetical protein H6Q69_960 [Firmicutes bacterium]|nr:hypothetical protein [Bacillota bacterium]
MKKRRGVFGIEIGLILIGLILFSYGVAICQGGQFILLDNKKIALQAQQLAQQEINVINATSYSDAESLAKSLTTIAGTSFSREIVVGSESTNSSGYNQRTITVNIYKTGENVIRFTTSTTLSAETSSSSSHGKTRFTSSGTFTVPSGISTVWVSMCGGGGGGGFYTYSCGGGGADAVLAQETTVTEYESITITVGSGGSAGSSSSYKGGTGGTSSFGSYISCAGGGGGSTTCGSTGGSGGSAGGSNYSYNAIGYAEGYATYVIGGNGGSSIFGSGGKGGFQILSKAVTGKAGGGYGAGGGGGGRFIMSNGPQGLNWNLSSSGGAGSAGMVLVEW